MRRLAHGLIALFHRRRADADLDAELRAFLDEAIEARLAAGMPRADAERAARLELGSPAAVKEWTRDVGWESRLESLWLDVRYALRLMRRSPAFCAAMFISIVLGTGGMIAMSSVLYGTLLRPLPVRDERSLAVLYAVDKIRSDGPVSYPRLAAWRDSGVFSDLAGFTPTTLDIAVGGFAERTAAQSVTAAFFRTLGVAATRGRLLDDLDARPAESTVPAVISYQLWTRRFNADEAVLGRSVPAGTRMLTIVGVAPPGLERWRGEAHIWIPTEAVHTTTVLQSDGYRLFTPIARFWRDGDSPLAGRLAAINKAFEQAEAHAERDRPPENVRVVSLREDVVSPQLRYGMYALLLGVALTWIVVCANVTNLMLGRGMHRVSELSVRLALGAHRWRIARQLLLESAVVAIPAGAAGVLMAFWAVRLLSSIGPPTVAGNGTVRLDTPVLLAALALIVVTVISCGAVPAVRLSGTSLQSRNILRPRSTRFSPILLGAQFAIAVVVLIGAVLAVKSAWEMQRVEVGFRPDHVLTARFQFLGRGLQDPQANDRRALAIQHAILERLRGLPGVGSVTVADTLFRPSHQIRWSIGLDDGRRYLNGQPEQRPFTPRPHTVGADYFLVHGVPLLEGREFTFRDNPDSKRVIIVNRTMAHLLWPSESAIGRRLNFGGWSPRRGFDEPWHEIVGVVADMRYGSLDEPLLPEVYQPATQEPLRAGGYVVLKTVVNPRTLSASVREQLRAVDSAIAVHPPLPLETIVAESVAPTRYSAMLLMICAAITMVLSTFGVYSLLTYVVASMQHELGVRLALGASAGRLTGAVLLLGVTTFVPGVSVGLVLAALVSPVLGSVLFAVSPRDPVVFAAAGGAIVLVGVAAAWMAARRAARVDPLVALRAE